MLYSAIILLLFFLSYKYDIKGIKVNKQLWYYSVLTIFILLAGLRYRIGGDTVEYIYKFYYDYPTLCEFSFEEYPIGRDPLYVLLNSLVKTLGGKFYVVQLIHAAFINILVFKYFKRHTPFVFTCVVFYFIGFYFILNTEILRGSFSVVICLFANDYIMQKKWLKGLLLYFIATLFHAQTLVIAVTPLFFYFLRFNIKGYFFLLIMFVVSFSIQRYFGSLIDTLDTMSALGGKAAYYNDDEGFGKSGTFNYFVVAILPYLIYIVSCFIYNRKRGENRRIFAIEPFLLMGVMFWIMLMNVSVANRFVDYYRVYFAILYAETFVRIAGEGKNLISKNAIVKALVVFLPMFMLQYGTFTRLGDGVRYNPYSSVIERNIDPQREKYYNNIGLPSPQPEKY